MYHVMSIRYNYTSESRCGSNACIHISTRRISEISASVNLCQGVPLHCYAVFHLTGEHAGPRIPSSPGRSGQPCVTEGHSLNNVEPRVHVRRCHSSLHSRTLRVLYCVHTAAPNANRAAITSSHVQENKDIRRAAQMCYFIQIYYLSRECPDLIRVN